MKLIEKLIEDEWETMFYRSKLVMEIHTTSILEFPKIQWKYALSGIWIVLEIEHIDLLDTGDIILHEIDINNL